MDLQSGSALAGAAATSIAPTAAAAATAPAAARRRSLLLVFMCTFPVSMGARDIVFAHPAGTPLPGR